MGLDQTSKVVVGVVGGVAGFVLLGIGWHVYTSRQLKQLEEHKPTKVRRNKGLLGNPTGDFRKQQAKIKQPTGRKALSSSLSPNCVLVTELDEEEAAIASEIELRDGYREEVYNETNGQIKIASLSEYFSTIRPLDEGEEANMSKDVKRLVAMALVNVLGPKLAATIMPVMPGILSSKAAEMIEDSTGADTLANVLLQIPTTMVSAIGGISLSPVGAFFDAYFTLLMYKSRQKQIEAAAAEAAEQQEEQNTGGKKGNRRDYTMDSSDESDMECCRLRDNEEDGSDEADAPKTIIERFCDVGENPGDYPLPFPSGKELPNPFILTEHFMKTIKSVEPSKEDDPEYDPNAHPIGQATPLDEDLLPDLHMGFGGIKCTNTNRQILYNRLLSILLNRLGANDVAVLKKDDDNNQANFDTDDVSSYKQRLDSASFFTVQIDPLSKPIKRPDALVKELIDSGHDVSIRPRVRVTSCGLGICVNDSKEEDAKENPRWVQIPIGICLKSGYEDSRGRSANSYLNHGGIDLDIKNGPIVPSANIQHFHCLTGFAGWQSNHYWDAPFLTEAVDSDGWSEEETTIERKLQAVRLSSMSAIVVNTVADEGLLPCGGYGVTGVCNDTGAMVEYAMTGKTDLYPLMSVSRYRIRQVRVAKRYANIAATAGIRKKNEIPKEVQKDWVNLANALMDMSSDYVASPHNSAEDARRIIHSMPPSKFFSFMSEGKEVLESVIKESEEWKQMTEK